MLSCLSTIALVLHPEKKSIVHWVKWYSKLSSTARLWEYINQHYLLIWCHTYGVFHLLWTERLTNNRLDSIQSHVTQGWEGGTGSLQCFAHTFCVVWSYILMNIWENVELHLSLVQPPFFQTIILAMILFQPVTEHINSKQSHAMADVETPMSLNYTSLDCMRKSEFTWLQTHHMAPTLKAGGIGVLAEPPCHWNSIVFNERM